MIIRVVNCRFVELRVLVPMVISFILLVQFSWWTKGRKNEAESLRGDAVGLSEVWQAELRREGVAFDSLGLAAVEGVMGSDRVGLLRSH